MKLSFTPLIGDYAICRLPADAPYPDWADGAGVVSVTRAEDELSLVCQADRLPIAVTADTGWSTLRVDTLADLDEAGVVMAAVTPISSAGFGVFLISTHLRDYLLVRTGQMADVKRVLLEAGHTIV